jgi:hypothetical protein
MMSVSHQQVALQSWGLYGESVMPNLEGDVTIAKSDM